MAREWKRRGDAVGLTSSSAALRPEGGDADGLDPDQPPVSLGLALAS